MKIFRYLLLCCAVLVLLANVRVAAAQLRVIMPLGRVDYQTNETIDIAVVRQDTQALPAGVLTLTVTGEDASKLTFTFPVKAVAVVGNDARTTEVLHLNGWLLRPEVYTVQVNCDGATAQTPIQLYNHIRKSTFRTVHWWGPLGAAEATQLAPEGENGVGFNLILGGTSEPSIRGHEDVMGIMLMGGGHQFDLKQSNDWSDPNVYIGANQRAADRAFAFRTMPNAFGAHLYDEPGLTYATSPPPHNENGPWDIATQRRAYKDAFGKEQMWHDEVKPNDPENMAQWTATSEFREGFMDAFWKSANNTLSKLKPGYQVVTQSQYGWWAFFDGYYFNVARSLPIISGHGGYDDYPERNFAPSYFVEFSLPRQMDKPTWYLPQWGYNAPELFREEQYLSFISGIQGLSSPPATGGLDVNASTGATETNKEMARLGTIFAKPAYTRQEVAILYSKSDVLYATKVRGSTMDALGLAYIAAKMTQYPTTIVLEEDILDGTLAASHKALVLTDIHYLDPNVITALQEYIKDGGAVLMTDDCTVNILGAVKIGATYKLLPPTTPPSTPSLQEVLKRTEPIARALKAHLLKLGIRPAFGTTAAEITAGRQVRGDIEYLFAVNYTTTDPSGKPNPVASTITLPDDGRPVYDAMRGGLMTFEKKGQELSAALRFGPGQMRVFARPARPIGGVQVGVPVITRDYTRESEPLTLDISATLVDTKNQLIAGTAPLEIIVSDPLGGTRYDIFRATEQGTCNVSLPLAVNDPAGAWTVTVKELLNNSAGKASFTYQAVPHCGAVAGKTQRAVYYPYDKENIYQFFRNNRTVTIVTGKSDYNAAAAERLVTALAPYNVRCTIMTADEANKPRELTAEEAKTWCGTSIAGDANPGRGNNPAVVGFDLPGPSVLLGTPEDNPLIRHLQGQQVLPYPVNADFPGCGHGLVAWNTQTLGHDLESVVCIGYDADGMSEAVGTLFQLAVGLDTLTPYVLPTGNMVKAATLATDKPAAAIAWQALVPDKVVALVLEGANVTAYSWDGSMSTFDAKGKVIRSGEGKMSFTAPPLSKDVSKLPKDKLLTDLAVKQVLPGAAGTAVSYWGGTVQIFAADGTLKTQQMLPQDISALLWHGDTLVCGLADGEILALASK